MISLLFSMFVKVELSLYLTKHHAIKTDRRSGGIAPRILNFGTI
jgi:hypothetical protein